MKERKKELIVIGIFLFVCIIGNLSNHLQGKQISNNKQIACAKINKIASDRFSLKAYYSFNVRGVDYTGLTSCGVLNDYGIKNYVGKHFIVVYDSTNAEKNEIIFLKEQLSDYNLSIENWNNCADSAFQIPSGKDIH